MATNSMRDLLNVSDLSGMTFIDVGCGSGIFSLAAEDLGADRVYSFDFDPDSAACAERVRSSYSKRPARWSVERGDCLDIEYVARLGTFDVVYSWGVLHHTGDLWTAVDHTTKLVAPGGILAIALYNDQGWRSKLWTIIKRSYCLGPVGRIAVVSLVLPWLVIRGAAHDVLQGNSPVDRYNKPNARGMVAWRDYIDWLGGYPFETAPRSTVREFLVARGFEKRNERSVGRGSGCNEFVFVRKS
jgi:2-polyprenyl-6-hydroxyphenyl methylase/3-demethylubiquinone-9 3-methyltransferase